MISIVMTGTGVYVPRNKVYNEEIDEHFESMGLNAHSLMEHLGRRKRYFISEGENAITMCQNAIDWSCERTLKEILSGDRYCIDEKS